MTPARDSDAPPAEAHSRRRRLLAALAIGLLAAGLCELVTLLPGPGASDFRDPWLGARALLAGDDPYAAVRAMHPQFGLYYPLTALLAILPLAALSLVHAQSLFVGLGMAALAYALGGWSPMVIGCVGAGALACVVSGQWGPALTAAARLPLLGFLWAAKPSIGLALMAGYPRRRALIGAAALSGLSLIVWPAWPAAWLPGLGDGVHRVPVGQTGGVLLLLALLRWRRPEARMLAVLACLPQSLTLYETVPLCLIPASRGEAYLLTALSQLAALLMGLQRTDLPLIETQSNQWPILFLGVYLPALVMVLRRPNEAGRIVTPAHERLVELTPADRPAA